MKLKKSEIYFLCALYISGFALRFIPRLSLEPFLPTFAADIWYRLCMAQYLLDFGHLAQWDIRYSAYGQVPAWYPPGCLYFFALLQKITSMELAVVASRIMPLIESFVIIPFYFLCRYLYNVRIAVIASLFLALTPSFIFWSGVSTPQGFTMFCLPIVILFWITFTEKKYILNSPWAHLVLMGVLMAVNFLTHLTYFNTVIILLLIQLALVREGRSSIKGFLYLLVPVFVSHLLTSWWWLPNNLYWWWTTGLSTSTSFFEGAKFLKQYGPSTAAIGHICFMLLIFIVLRQRNGVKKYYAIPLCWTLFPLVESHMEVILTFFGQTDLVWNNMLRPIEGFRFYSFLAQPLAICFALVLNTTLESDVVKKIKIPTKKLTIWVMTFMCAVLTVDMFVGYGLVTRFRYHVVSVPDVDSARWYRKVSSPDDRILADYYTAQLFSGICSGRALLGSMFPLKKADIPYITDSWEVLYDIYQAYSSDDIDQVKGIMQKYKITHVFLSDIALRRIEFLVNGYGDLKGFREGKFDVLIGRDFSETLLNPKYFTVVYRNEGIKIMRFRER